MIHFLISLATLLILVIFVTRTEKKLKWFDEGELHRTLAGLQQRMTKARKRKTK